MPATEQTWYNQKRMHIIFGITSLLMLLFTIWMLVQDHNREWKKYQEEYYGKLEVWDLESRILAQTMDDAFTYGMDAREDVRDQFAAQVPAQSLLELFYAEMRYDAARRAAEAEDALTGLNESRAIAQAELIAAVRESGRYSQRIAQAAIDVRIAELSGGDAAEAVARRDRSQLARDAVIETLADESATFRAQAADSNGSSEAEGAINDLQAAYEVLQGADEETAAEARVDLRELLADARAEAMFRESSLQQSLKFKRAEFDGENSLLGIAINNGDSPEAVADLQASVDEIQAAVVDLNARYEAANLHRLTLDQIIGVIDSNLSTAEKSIDSFKLDLDNLEKAYEAAAGAWDDLGRDVVTLPILDAFNNSDIEVKHIWLPDLTQNYNHKQVARFDRCITCHLGIDKTAPGTATTPNYEPAYVIEGLQLATPSSPPDVEPDSDSRDLLVRFYGISLADSGIFDSEDALIDLVMPRSAGADALLKRGDVIERIYVDGSSVRITSIEQAYSYLLDNVKWGEPIVLDVRRGVPQPYGAHPRLDLYGTDSSPHPFKDIGCTICHEGQGNATQFKWASHSPSNIAELKSWSRDHEWFDNHHWIYPMYPERFLESSCLRCHHSVMELNPSERFPEPPAPKLMAGYDAVRTYGCFGCHEVNGYAGGGGTIGPDLRLEPNYVPAAQSLHVSSQLDDAAQAARGDEIFTADAPEEFKSRIQSLAGRLVASVDDDVARRELVALINADVRRADPSSDENAYLNGNLHGLASVLADQDTPGAMRKVGPSLRYLNAKVNPEFVYGWIMEPSDFRPSTRMPQFFGQYGHFLPYTAEESEDYNEPGHTQNLEQVEALAMTHYLQSISQEFGHDAQPTVDGDLLPPDAERGKLLFETKGCLACHGHGEFPEANQDQGPDLSNLGAKLKGEKGRQWLTSWLREPSRYHARTKMPNVFLLPEPDVGPTGIPHADPNLPEGAAQNTDVASAPLYDPAADIAAYLLSQDNSWTPKHALPDIEGAEFQEAMRELAMEYLATTFTGSQAARFYEEGIPLELEAELKGDEVELVGAYAGDAAAQQEHVLNYLGRKSIGKYGCYGCHDIAGFESAKPIGTTLSDWGRKDASKLAFEQVGQLIHMTDMSKDHSGHSADGHGALFHAPEVHVGEHDEHDALDIEDVADRDPDQGYYLNSLLAHQRTGFIWQKLRAPRSYDYSKAALKRYNERLKMPMFPFDEQQREEVITFVLGLVADPPAEKYVYAPDARQQAINEGNIVLEKYNCAGCHELEIDRWTFNYDPATFPETSFPANEYEVFRQFHTQQEIAASREVDARGLGTATVVGRKTRDENGNVQQIEGLEETDPPIEFIDLWEPALINGQTFLAGDPVDVRSDRYVGHIPARGGFFARYLHDRVLARVRGIDPPATYGVNPSAKYLDAWGWVPPPLFNEGEKVQPEWLYNFLLEPEPIRYAAVLRMPKFNMSHGEARALANYFAARENTNYPYEFETRSVFQTLEAQSSTSTLALEGDAATEARLKDAMTIVTNGNYCIKCHKIGDYSPGGDITALAPNLENVYRRIRPEFLYPWLANPKRKLPFTGMPVNFPQNQPIRPNLFQADVPKGDLIHNGLSQEQLEAVVDLLLNYDWYMRRQQSIVPLINQPPAGVTTDGASPQPNDE